MAAVTHEIIEQSTREVLEMTAGAAVLTVDHSAEAGGIPVDVVGTLTLSGTLGGTVVVYCGRAEAGCVVGGMLGLEAQETDEEMVLDAIGELLNQIAGTIKRKLGVSENEISLSVPVVVTGTCLSRSVKSLGKPVTVHAALDAGTFGVSFWMSDGAATAALSAS